MIFPPGQLIILPSTLAVRQAQERLLHESTTGVVLWPAMMSFGRLEQTLVEEMERARALVSDLGREMRLAGILVECGRDIFGTVASTPENVSLRPGWRRQVIDLLDDWRTAGMSANQLVEVGSGVIPEKKLAALATVAQEYDKFLDESALTDRAGIRMDIRNQLEKGLSSKTLYGVHKIIFKDFQRFTPFQIEVLKGLAHAVPHVQVHFSVPRWLLDLDQAAAADEDEQPFREILKVIRELETVAGSGLDLELIFDHPDSRQASRKWLEYVFRPMAEQPVPPPPGYIQVVAAPGTYAETDHIGRTIHCLLSNGVSPHRVGVAVPDLGSYGQMFEDVFRRLGLPLFFRRGAPLIIQAPARALLALFNLASSNWGREQVLDLLASPYLDPGIGLPWTRVAELSARAGVTDDLANGGWKGNLARLARLNPVDQEDLTTLWSALEQLKIGLEPLSQWQTVSTFVDLAKSLLDSMAIQKCILEGPAHFLVRDAAARAGLLEILDSLKIAAREAGLVDTAIPPSEFIHWLKSGLSSRNIGPGNPAANGIMVLSFYDLHGLTFDYLFMAGLNEGKFPRPHLGGSILTDLQKRTINRKVGRQVFTTAHSGYRQEQILFYYALSAAEKGLILSYCRLDEHGRLRLPSPVLDEVLDLWTMDAPTLVVGDAHDPSQGKDRAVSGPSLPTEHNQANSDNIILHPPLQVLVPVEQSLTPLELFGQLAVALRPGRPMLSLIRQLINGLGQKPEYMTRWRSIVHRARVEQARTIDLTKVNGRINSLTLDPWLASLPRHQEAPLVSPKFFQDYGECPWDFWADHVLGLRPALEPEEQLNSLDEGSILHQILFRFVSRCRDNHRLPLQNTREHHTLLREVIGEVWIEAENRYPLGRRLLWQTRRQNMIRSLERWLKNEARLAHEGKPLYLEWSFGPDCQTPPLEIPFLAGGRLFFQGRVDRLDQSPNHVRVIDYKSSSNAGRYKKQLSAETLGRTSFQLPVYQLAAARSLKLPAMAGYVFPNDFLLDSPKWMDLGTDAVLFSADLECRQAMKDTGLDNFFNRVEEAWNNLSSGDFRPQPSAETCRHCDYLTACRRSAADEPES